MANPADSALHDQVALAIGGRFVPVDDLIVEGDEKVTEVVQREDRDTGITSDTGEPIYGMAPGTPIAMNVSVLDGEITRTAMVYLP